MRPGCGWGRPPGQQDQRVDGAGADGNFWKDETTGKVY
jgi:hypothetical protein